MGKHYIKKYPVDWNDFFLLRHYPQTKTLRIFSPQQVQNTMQAIQVARLHHPTTAKTSRVNRYPLEVPIYTCMSL